MNKLVSFVEGQGDGEAVPQLIKKLFHAMPAEEKVWEHVSPAPAWRVGNIGLLLKDDYREWTNKLRAATKDPSVKGILLLLDGDSKQVLHRPFCAKEFAIGFAESARRAGAGATFSVAVVFAMREYETWLIASATSLAGEKLSSGRSGLAAATVCPAENVEMIRDAKGWLSQTMDRKYKETLDQSELTQLVDVSEIRKRNVKSFGRLERAVVSLVRAIKTGQHISSPT